MSKKLKWMVIKVRAVVQRAQASTVEVQHEVVGKISKGLVVFLGISKEDGEKDCEYIANKVEGLRIFEDEEGKMNLSVKDIVGEIMLISQFTLYGDSRKGRRPSFVQAAYPQDAIPLYEKVGELLREKGLKVETGVFQEHMRIKVDNDGPVTILLDSYKQF